ncbi:MAG: hypothetical protein FK733_09185 [Asgard group archaeon]|nr:hypothetical protein [Asgard group archaeon]
MTIDIEIGVISIIAIALALAVGLTIVLLVFIIKIIGSTIKGKQEQQISVESKTITKKVATTGKHLNRFYQFSIYFIIFSVLLVFLLLASFTFGANLHFVDIWPFLFLVVVLIIFSLSIIDRAKAHSKRTTQRDMREI